MGKFTHKLLLCSASALALAVPAMAQTTVLTPTSPNYDIVGSTDTVVEISSGTSAYFMRDGMQWALPANTPGLYVQSVGGWMTAVSGDSSCIFSWECAKSNAPLIRVDSGATLTFGGTQWQSWYNGGHDLQSIIEASGDVIFQGGGTWSFLGTNRFLGNVTVLDGANLQFGWDWSAAHATFGPNTNIDLQGNSQLIFWNSGTMTVGGRISGSATSIINLNSGTLVVNGQNTAATPFLGTVNVAADQSFVVGDSAHPSAVFGDPTGRTAHITLSGNTSTLSGYGTIYGNVDNAGRTIPGSSNGSVGTLTINGNLTLHDSSQTYATVSPAGASAVIVNGNAQIGGELIITIADGAYGNSISPLVTATNLTGSFNSIQTEGNVSGAIIGLMQSSSGYSVVTEKGTSTQVFGHVVYANRMALTNFVGSLYDAMAMTPASGAMLDTWATAIGGAENLSRAGVGYDQKTYGASFGAMHRFERHGGVVGMALSYRRGDMSVKDDPATAATNGYDFALYGGADVNALRFEGSAFYNVYDADTSRPMGTYGTSRASQSGYAFGASAQISHEMFGDRVAPYIRGMYARLHLNAASESGSDQYDLMHEAINVNTLVTDLGIRAHLLLPQPDRRLKLDADVAWRYDLSDPGETVTAGFANFSSGTSESFWQIDSKHALRAGLDVAGQVSDRMEIFGRLGGTFTSHRRSGELAIGAKYKF